MIIIDKKVILYFEPKNNKSSVPVIDDLTIKMFNAFKAYNATGIVNNKYQFIQGISTMGTHECICGERSHAKDYLIENDYIVNSLCVHYLALHRDEVSQEDIDKVNSLTSSTKLDEIDKEKLMYMICDTIGLEEEKDKNSDLDESTVFENDDIFRKYFTPYTKSK